MPLLHIIQSGMHLVYLRKVKKCIPTTLNMVLPLLAYNKVKCNEHHLVFLTHSQKKLADYIPFFLLAEENVSLGTMKETHCSSSLQ